MLLTASQEVPWPDPVVASFRGGDTSGKRLARSTTSEGLNFSFTLARFGQGDRAFETPRHRHTFGQVRIAIEGEYNLAPGLSIREGQVAVVPPGTAYGPQRVEGNTAAVLQYGFGDDYLGGARGSGAALRSTVRELLERGSFDGGRYQDRDPVTGQPRSRDAVEAITEHRLGRPVQLPAPQYELPILVDPAAFRWGRTPRFERLLVRELGCFGDQRLGLYQLRWDDSAPSFRLELDRAQLLLSITAGLVVDGRRYPSLTCVFSDRGEEFEVGADPATEAWLIELPTPSSPAVAT